MSTRFTQFDPKLSRHPSGYEVGDVPDDFSIPSCTLEDADRAVFDLFNEQIPLQFYQSNELKKIPVIFATGERFAVLNRKNPLRDKNKTLVLPLISILRTDISQDPENGMGPGQMHPSKVKIKITPESDNYKRIINKLAILNQDNVASKGHLNEGDGKGVIPGTVGTRRRQVTPTLDDIDGGILRPDLKDNIYEIITMPPVKFYQSTYNITIWAQFTQQMNDILSAIMSSYQNNYGRTFRLETKKGYWFSGFVDKDFSSGENYDDFTDSERLIKQSFNIRVNAYLILPSYPGSPNGLRRTISAPSIEFKVDQVNGTKIENLASNVPSASPSSYILNDIVTGENGIPGQAIAADKVNSGLTSAGTLSDNSSVIGAHIGADNVPDIGGHLPSNPDLVFYRYEIDPFTGKKRKILVGATQSRTSAGDGSARQGETVYREGIVLDLGKI